MTEKERIFSRLRCVALAVCCVLIGSLEVAAAPTFTVNSPSDVVDANAGDGVCEIASGNGVCTLRAAIMEANQTPGGGATIILPAGTYILTTVQGIGIDSSMSILGRHAANTIIDGNGGSMFGISSGTTVSIASVTIRNGQSGEGGGIANFGGTLTISNSTISGNSAPGDCDFTGYGGGVSNDGFGTLTMIDSTVSGNSAGCEGGGIANFQNSTLTMISSTVSGNVGSLGGGIFNIGALTMFNSTISGNNGRGIANFPGGPGGGNNVGAIHLFNSTITQNGGGGVSNFGSAIFTFQNTILAGNFTESGVDECAGTFTSNGFNLMQSFDASRCTINGGGVTLADPKLGPLQDNGGPTDTHALVAGSPAIDAGNTSGCRDNAGTPLPTDQRGFARPADGNNDGTARCDIGAYEANALIGKNSAFVFQQYIDFLDREPDAGEVSAWVSVLDSGLSRADLIEAFMNSGEFRFEGKFITQTYLGILTRDADYAGFRSWLGALLVGLSREQIVQVFLDSGEFQSRFGSNLTNEQFVERMYNNILLRSSDPGGFNAWVGALNNGQLTKAQVALSFLDSGEFQGLFLSQNRVDTSLLYFDLLQRDPDAGGFSYWVEVLSSGVSLTSVIDGFLNSPEYQAGF